MDSIEKSVIDAAGFEHDELGHFVGRVPGRKAGQRAAEHRFGVRRYEEVHTKDPKVREVYPRNRSVLIGTIAHQASGQYFGSAQRKEVHAHDRHGRKVGVYGSHAEAVAALARLHAPISFRSR